jgi:trehalose 6-phosphate synthase
VAAQDPDDPGVLILSNMVGAARELTDALLVNPYDTNGIARTIRSALVMPLSQRRARHERLLAILHENDIHRWHMRFLEQLTRESPISAVPMCASWPPSSHSGLEPTDG